MATTQSENLSMNVLVLGSGGREHALVSALSASPSSGKIYCAPGNAGIAQEAELLDLPLDDFDGLTSCCARAGHRLDGRRAGGSIGRGHRRPFRSGRAAHLRAEQKSITTRGE